MIKTKHEQFSFEWDKDFNENSTIDNRQLRGCKITRATLSGISTTNYHPIIVCKK